MEENIKGKDITCADLWGSRRIKTPRIAGESAYKVGKVVNYTHRPLSPEDSPGTDSKAIVWKKE
jgi:hypothetical protein